MTVESGRSGRRLCHIDEMPEGGSRGFDPFGAGHDTVLVVRQGGGLHAWRDACPHVNGARMAWRKDAYLNARRDRIVCSAHGSQFDIVTGVCTLGACLGQSLERVDVRLTEDGFVSLPFAAGPLSRGPAA